MTEETTKSKKISNREPARIIRRAQHTTAKTEGEEPVMVTDKTHVDPIETLAQDILKHIRDADAQETVGALIFSEVFDADTDVLNPWQLYTNAKKKTYDAKYSKYEKAWNALIEKLAFLDIDQLRKWYRIEASRQLEKEIRDRAKELEIEVVATFDWTQKRIDELMKGAKGKEVISAKIKDWLQIKDAMDKAKSKDEKPKKKQSKSDDPTEKLQKKIDGITKVVNDSFLWKRLLNSKTFEGMTQKQTDQLIETLAKAEERLSALAKGAENAMVLRRQLAEK